MLQVVFLVDVNSTKWMTKEEAQGASDAVRLCALKILRYIIDRLCSGRLSSLKWGFKFFSSSALVRDYGRHEFNDLRVGSFEDFELRTSRRFEEEFEKASNEPQEQPTQEQYDEEVITVDPLKALPVKCLTCALTELVHDFIWEKLDICSPVKGPVSEGGDADQEAAHNIVFLLSDAPCSEKAMKEFTGEPACTAESFKSASVPTALLNQLKHTCRIRLFWIDTGLQCKQQTQQVRGAKTTKTLVTGRELWLTTPESDLCFLNRLCKWELCLLLCVVSVFLWVMWVIFGQVGGGGGGGGG